MPQTITPLPPTARYVDYSAEIPLLDSNSIESVNFWSGDEGLTFAVFLDVINPLQHLPVISSIYRAVTGDEISLGARLLGGALFGGPIGILTAGVNAAFEEMSGGNIAEHAAALFEEITGSDDEKPQLALEPNTTKSGVLAAMAPAGPAGQVQIIPQNTPSRVPAPTAILPPIKPSSIIHQIDNSGDKYAAPEQHCFVQRNARQRRIAPDFPFYHGRTTGPGAAPAGELVGWKGKSGKDKPGATPTQSAQRGQAQSVAQQAVQATMQARTLIPACRAEHPNLPPTGASAA